MRDGNLKTSESIELMDEKDKRSLEELSDNKTRHERLELTFGRPADTTKDITGRSRPLETVSMDSDHSGASMARKAAQQV